VKFLVENAAAVSQEGVEIADQDSLKMPSYGAVDGGR
jgi:hypothetical protein